MHVYYRVWAIPQTDFSVALFRNEQYLTHIMLSSGLEYLDLFLTGLEMRKNSILVPSWNVPEDLTERWQISEIIFELESGFPLSPDQNPAQTESWAKHQFLQPLPAHLLKPGICFPIDMSGRGSPYMLPAASNWLTAAQLRWLVRGD